MGEWSEYFEDFPEDNPANQVNGKYDPEGAARIRAQELQRAKVLRESKALQKSLMRLRLRQSAIRIESLSEANNRSEQTDAVKGSKRRYWK